MGCSIGLSQRENVPQAVQPSPSAPRCPEQHNRRKQRQKDSCKSSRCRAPCSGGGSSTFRTVSLQGRRPVPSATPAPLDGQLCRQPSQHGRPGCFLGGGDLCADGQQTPLGGGGRGMCRPAREGRTACGTFSLVRPARSKPGGKTGSESREGKRASHRGKSQVSGQAPPDPPPLLPRTTPRPALLSARLRPPRPGLFLPSLSSSPSTRPYPRNVLTCRPGTRPSCHGRARSGDAGCSEGAAGPGRAPRPR